MDKESITKAAQAANLLSGDLREAHKASCDAGGPLEILLRDLLGQAVVLETRLKELEGCFKMES